MAEEQGADSPQAEQQPLDYDSMSLEEIEKRLADGEGLIVEDEPVPSEPQAEAAPEEAPAEEPTPEPAGAEAKAEEEAPAETPPEVTEEEVDLKQLAIDELQAQLDRTEAERKKFEFLQSRDAGQAGFLKKQLEEVQQQLSSLAQPPADDAELGERPRQQYVAPSDPALQSRLAELETDARMRGLEAEYQAFMGSLTDADGNPMPEEGKQGLVQKMAPSIQEQLEPYKDLDLNAKSARKVLRMVLDSAYADLKLQEVRERRAEALKRKASQVPAKRQQKLAASVTGSGGAPAPAPKPKAVEDMTAEEADAALIREFGDGHHRRARR